MDAITTALIEHGVTGIMLAFFVWYLVRRDNENKEERTQHLEERKEWKVGMDSHVDRIIDSMDNNTAALNQLNVRVEKAECKLGKTG